VRIFGRTVSLRRAPVETPAQRDQRARAAREAAQARRRADAQFEKHLAAAARRQAEQAEVEWRAQRAAEAAEEIARACREVGFWFPGDHHIRERPSLRGGGLIQACISRITGRW
jgi:hypothetical protein